MTIQCGFRNDHREGERSAPTKGPVNRSLERSGEKSKQTVNPETDKENFVPRCGVVIVRQEPSPTVFFFCRTDGLRSAEERSVSDAAAPPLVGSAEQMALLGG